VLATNVLCSIVGSDALVAPSEIGMKVIECFNNITLLNENVEVDKYVCMPNHIHGIIVKKNTELIEVQEKKYDFKVTERRGRRSLHVLSNSYVRA
jgi:REP element-mobilizing transposase RayT